MVRKSKKTRVVVVSPGSVGGGQRSDVVVNVPRPVQSRGPRRKAAKLRALSRINTPMTSLDGFKDMVLQSSHSPETATGIDFIRDALNPCGEDPLPELEGIPDGSGTDAVLAKFRDDILYGPPVGATEWSTITFSTPYLMSQMIILRFAGTTPPIPEDLRMALNALTTTLWDGPARYPNFHNITTLLSDAGTLMPYGGVPFELSNFVPAALAGAFDSTQNAPGWTYFRKWRTVSKGHTVHLNAPDLANEGREVAASTATESSVKNIALAVGAANNPIIAARYTVSPPYTDNVLAQQDSNSRQDVAKKGSYCQQRHWNRAIIWNEAEDARPIWRAPSAAFAGANVTVPDADYLKRDGFDLNLGWVVQNIRGLSPMAEIHIKHRTKIEFNVPGTSPWAPFTRSALEEDAGAMNLYYCLSSKLPHLYDASFNDWGFLAGIITKCLGGVANPLLRKALSVGSSMIHGLVEKGISMADRQLAKYGSYTGATGYGDRTFD